MNCHEHVYRRLLRIYPPTFRERYGEDMVELFGTQLREARSSPLGEGTIRLWSRSLADVLSTASSQHLGELAAAVRSFDMVTVELIGATTFLATCLAGSVAE